MSLNSSGNISYLDRIRITEDLKKCKMEFDVILQIDKNSAISLINDHQTSFPCVFVNLTEIEPLGLQYHLSSRNKMTLNIMKEKLSANKSGNEKNYLSRKNSAVFGVLKWMVETGHTEDGFNNEYDQIMDVAISVLIHLYQEKSILPIVANMIFARNKKELYIHDLVWAMFQFRDPYVLKLIAQRLHSSDEKDRQLAMDILNINELNRSGTISDTKYETYLNWLAENDPFLYFTGESFQFASKPAVCKVDLERKYLGQGIPQYNKVPITPSSPFENECLQVFKPLSKEEKNALSNYSYQLHRQNASGWKEWVRSPIHEQLQSAKNSLEGVK